MDLNYWTRIWHVALSAEQAAPFGVSVRVPLVAQYDDALAWFTRRNKAS